MAFGITRAELQQWKEAVVRGELAFLTHYWYDPRFPDVKTVTKVGCSDLETLVQWCEARGLNPQYIHHRRPFPHFDLIGQKQLEILRQERLLTHLHRFRLI
ncbi:hypothetical protein [Paenibacillus xerothermodurans]|uniref:Uncharacterized protein n=1 Tax=Paenibacillus xerothermodurans TaxID=1977292 RepID=A0A2W1NCD0_PAEXE|nr:hypothetical protein [Paenibacillus xerothermodurans]PZE22359.1 hypothetical protein CBW46_000800 [Paenibacillus xerothermodurans]